MSLLKSSRSVWSITRSERLPHSTDCSRLSRVEKELQSDRQLVPLIISPLWLLIMTLKHDISEWSVYMYKHNVAYFLVELLKPHKLQRLVFHYNREISILQRSSVGSCINGKYNLISERVFICQHHSSRQYTLTWKNQMMVVTTPTVVCDSTHFLWHHLATPLHLGCAGNSSDNTIAHNAMLMLHAMLPVGSRWLTTHSLWDS